MRSIIKLRNFVLNNAADDYLPADGLIDAVEIAIALNKPLLVTGEPGTGKTKLAFWLADQLAKQTKNIHSNFKDTPFIFNTKSTSVASDLFYYYDAVSHFGKVQRSKGFSRLTKEDQDKDIRQFIELRAMGLAIAQTYGTTGNDLRGIRNYKSDEKDKPLAKLPMSSVVLIDEVDKAPREFANDLLNEIENYKFEIKELNKEVGRAENDCRIVTVLTSNDEKTLPNAFLRRCVFYHIDFPNGEKLLEIAKLKLGWKPEDAQYEPALKKAIEDFFEIRSNIPIKKAGTSELLDWVNILYHTKDEEGSILRLDDKGLLADSKKAKYNVLIKTPVDLNSIKNKV